MFSIPNNGPYFAATLATLTTHQIGKLMVQVQHDLDRATGLSHREILREVVRECAHEYRVREYPTCETH